MTQTITLGEGVAHVFVAVDHCNSECVGIHADTISCWAGLAFDMVQAKLNSFTAELHRFRELTLGADFAAEEG